MCCAIRISLIGIAHEDIHLCFKVGLDQRGSRYEARGKGASLKLFAQYRRMCRVNIFIGVQDLANYHQVEAVDESADRVS